MQSKQVLFLLSFCYGDQDNSHRRVMVVVDALASIGSIMANKAAVQCLLKDRQERDVACEERKIFEGSKLKLHTITWCPGDDMVADIMTKSTDPAKTKPQRDRAFYRLPKFLWN